MLPIQYYEQKFPNITKLCLRKRLMACIHLRATQMVRHYVYLSPLSNSPFGFLHFTPLD
jgi:hypothetical protein